MECLPLEEWISNVGKIEGALAENEQVLVVTIVGKDNLERTKVDDLNELLEGQFLDSWSSNGTFISAYYSIDLEVLFLVVSSYKDVPFLANFNAERKNFFDCVANYEEEYYRYLTCAISLSHIVLFVENSCRVDLSLLNTVRSVNRYRLSMVAHLKEDDGIPSEGRFSQPRLLFAFHRNPIRPELSISKKRELLERLQQSLEDQLFCLLKEHKIIEEPTQLDSLGYVTNENFAYLFDSTSTHDTIVSDVLENILGLESPDLDTKKRPPGLLSFLKQHVNKVRSGKKKKDGTGTTLPTVLAFCQLAKALLEGARQVKYQSKILNVMQVLSSKYEKEALMLYLPKQTRSTSQARGLSREEHEHRVDNVIRRFEGICIASSDALRVREECEATWQKTLRGCETVSMTGNACTLAAHPFGDGSNPSKWVPHHSQATFYHACSCGRQQALRRDPFSLKEANCDFYKLPLFVCCHDLEGHHFTLAGEAREEAPGEMLVEEEWPEARVVGQIDDGEEEESPLDTASEGDEQEDTNYFEGNHVVVRDDNEKNNLIREAEQMDRLREKGIEWTAGVPHSLLSLPPLFPSWSLLCIGPSSLYSHATGLRRQSGFIGGTTMVPLDVLLEVDAATWARDMKYVEMSVNQTPFTRRKVTRRHADNVERVKLFVGIEYECAKGHRQMVHSMPGYENVPGAELISSDLPLFQPCAFRKVACDNAQLMRLHVVTPKAPVTVSVDPKVEDPEGGVFHTGESPLQLSWSRYYVLRLPWIYEGPHGRLPRPSRGRDGTVKGNWLSVRYSPLASWIS